jgi:4-amino-4-deoxy-L-arabinose transferase-like glycosyltransferase
MKLGSMPKIIGARGPVVALLSLLLNVTWLTVTPPFDGSDEPAHLMALMHLRKHHELPEIHYTFLSNQFGETVPASGDSEVLAYAARYGNTYPVPYESMQPPLFYLSAFALSLPADDDPETLLYIGRLAAALFGAAGVYFIWAAIRQFASDGLAFLSALSVALLPQFAWNSGMAANDSALHFAGALTMYVWFRGLREPEYDPYMIRAGAGFGLMVLAKLTALTFILALALLVYLRAAKHDSLPRLMGLGLATALSTAAVCGWWVIRNLLIYGEPTGSQAAFRAYALHSLYTDGRAHTPGQLIADTFTSFIGRFSWFNVSDVYLPLWLYGAWAVLLSACIFATYVVLRRRTLDVRILGLLALITFGVLASYVQFNVQIAYEPQGRYLFVLLLPWALTLNAGLYALAQGSRHGWARAIAGLPAISLLFTHVVALLTYLNAIRT